LEQIGFQWRYIGSGDISVPYNPGGADRMRRYLLWVIIMVQELVKNQREKVDMKALRLALAGK
jgi:hypothetical protein